MEPALYSSEYMDEVYEFLVMGKQITDCGRQDLLELYRHYPFDFQEGLNVEYFCYEMIGDIWESTVWRSDDYRSFYALHFRDKAMTEYFRLCKAHAQREGIPYDEDPYVAAALKEVHDWMDSDCPCCDWRLKTFARNHSPAKLIFYFDEEFQWFAGLFSRLLRTLHFFQSSVEALRKEMGKDLPFSPCSLPGPG
mgnify:CR=1 FL=1